MLNLTPPGNVQLEYVNVKPLLEAVKRGASINMDSLLSDIMQGRDTGRPSLPAVTLPPPEEAQKDVSQMMSGKRFMSTTVVLDAAVAINRINSAVSLNDVCCCIATCRKMGCNRIVEGKGSNHHWHARCSATPSSAAPHLNALNTARHKLHSRYRSLTTRTLSKHTRKAPTLQHEPTYHSLHNSPLPPPPSHTHLSLPHIAPPSSPRTGLTSAQLHMLAYTLLFAGQHSHAASGLPPFKVAKAVLDQLGVEQGRRSALVYHLEAMEAQHRERFKDKPNRPSPLRPRTLILLLLLEVRAARAAGRCGCPDV